MSKLTKKLFLIGCILATLTSIANASEYVITGDGLYFGDNNIESWTTPLSKSGLICTAAEREKKDPAGGRGIIIEECWTPTTPMSAVTVKTMMYSSSKWSSCQVIGRENGLLKMMCPRIYGRN